MNSYFGKYGGQFVPETVMSALIELEKAYKKIVPTKKFQRELKELLSTYVGRPSPMYHAKRLSEHFGHNIYLKREDLNHTGAHKINNSIAQALLAKYMGKTKVLARRWSARTSYCDSCCAFRLRVRCVYGRCGCGKTSSKCP